ncbi:MAG TPA: [FeFe] hydrogenase H-cluster radical SAM maturase HydG [Sedimentisphaerales bacterium]|nr:[FeFe] hydrogenase H-cluster radical SAM maturase HydG [Sedimentisphaerales bacterium]HRS10067.1 [FeFe] hydrogenase H-cluster radical SAM maturase HydG [Sedimentisphaerales bacterium]HRV46773.1 [FeFe] hydrogenase H-cluster radical SAM maturase HydG [Sedimentisphaerales bacterium]
MTTVACNRCEHTTARVADWVRNRIKLEQIEKYLDRGRCFIDAAAIEQALRTNTKPDPQWVRDILQKSLAIETLTPEETACLIHVDDPELLAEMRQTARAVKLKVYDNRIVTFAPLYLGNLCVNNCAYCGFRSSNHSEQRRVLNLDEVRREVEVLAGQIGHKRLIVVYGEHPATDVHYIASTLRTIAEVKVRTRRGWGQIRRCNVNAAPMGVEELAILREAGIGTFQVFQETYHQPTYERLHPAGTVKGNYLWRLYAMHRAMEAGIDDVGIGPLLGLYDWRFEVVALVYHAIELERKFGIGPHTISFPRIEPAHNTPLAQHPAYAVGDDEFKKLVTVIRLAVPYTGMILTARENARLRREVLPLGCTQTDASSRIGIGAYADLADGDQQGDRQQFLLGDTRSLDTVIRELAEAGYITSFCTAGYRCGRTGQKIMGLLRSGREGRFCKLNAIITFREWLDDFGSPETIAAGEKVIAEEIRQVKEKMPEIFDQFMRYYEKTQAGDRDLYF